MASIAWAVLFIVCAIVGSKLYTDYKVERARAFLRQNRTPLDPDVRCTCMSQASWDALPYELRCWLQKEIKRNHEQA